MIYKVLKCNRTLSELNLARGQMKRAEGTQTMINI